MNFGLRTLFKFEFCHYWQLIDLLFALFLRWFTLGENSCHVTRTLKQAGGVVHVARNWVTLLKTRKRFLPTAIWEPALRCQSRESAVSEEDSWAPVELLDFCSPSQYNLLREADPDHSAEPLPSSGATKTVRSIIVKIIVSKIKGVLIYNAVHNICIVKYITMTSQIIYRRNWKYTVGRFLSYTWVV